MHEEVCHAFSSSFFSSFRSSYSSVAIRACVISGAVALPTLIAGTEGTFKKPFQKENFFDTFWNSLYVFWIFSKL